MLHAKEPVKTNILIIFDPRVSSKKRLFRSLLRQIRQRNFVASRLNYPFSQDLFMLYTSSLQWGNRTTEALCFIRSEAKKGTNSIGFLPWPKVCDLCSRNQAGIATENNDIVGFVLHGRNTDATRIFQIWTRADARRLLYGACLVRGVERFAIATDSPAISLKCATDLPAIKFWLALGFVPMQRIMAGSARARTLIRFERTVRTAHQTGRL